MLFPKSFLKTHTQMNNKISSIEITLLGYSIEINDPIYEWANFHTLDAKPHKDSYYKRVKMKF